MTFVMARLGRVSCLAALVLIGSTTAFPDTFSVAYSKPGVQTPATGINYENFNAETPGTSLGSPFTTTFGGSPYTGTYTGDLTWMAANGVGGADGTGTYATVFTGGSYSVTINPSINTFELWFSALDNENQLQFYNGSTLLYSFTPEDFRSMVGACPGGAYCGNPNSAFAHEDSTQQFAYLSFYDSGGSFDKVVFSEIGGGRAGFESDNQAVGVLTSPPAGTPITGTPEPSSLGAVAGASLVFACFVVYRRRNIAM